MRNLPFTFPAHLDVDLAGLCQAAGPWCTQLVVADQRVQAAPDARTVRYYQTTGLLDRPTRYDGRTACYGLRHLLQLVAVRALQSNGLSLSQVQALLTGASDHELQQTVNSAMGLQLSEGGTPHETTPTLPPLPPSPPMAPLAPSSTTSSASPPMAESRLAAPTSAPFALPALTAVELAPGVVVTIDPRIHTDSARTVSVLRRALTRALEASTDAPQGDLS